MPGHVHVVAGDITKIGCDAWLLPTDGAFAISDAFAAEVGTEADHHLADHRWNGSRVIRFEQTPAGKPQVWLADVGLSPGGAHVEASWFADVIEPFVRSAKDGRSPSSIPPLLAIPVLGTGDGGMAADKGRIYQELLPEMFRVAESQEVDLVLVCWGRRSFSAAQRVRRDLVAGRPLTELWDMGPKAETLVTEAQRLGELARDRQMVLFLGAGASAGAGFPTWQKLLDDIADEANLSQDNLEALRRLDMRDQASILKQRLTGSTLHEVIKERLKTTEYGLTQGLLASLPSREAITTNYDTLFESACEAIEGDRPAVLPYESANPKDRWLLKLHGCIARDESTVLTRADYLDIPSRHGALFGLVQAMLMTRHMFFVGYSLSDEDFHQLIHEVRLARGENTTAEASSGQADRRLGTTLTLFDDPLFEDLWRDDVRVVPIAEKPVGAPTDAHVAQAARWAQIFLDLVAMESADLDAYLLDDTYDELLDDNERRLAKALREIDTEALAGAHAGERVRRLLSDFGAVANCSEMRISLR